MANPGDIPTMQLTDVDGTEFEIHDHGAGEPVVFIHTMRDEWYAVLAEPALAEHYRLVHYHRRGFGNSTTDGVPLSIAEHASDRRAVMAHLGIAGARRCAVRSRDDPAAARPRPPRGGVQPRRSRAAAADGFTERWDTGFQHDFVAMNSWPFDAEDPARISVPVLNLKAEHSTDLHHAFHDAIKAWIPHAENAVLPDTGTSCPRRTRRGPLTCWRTSSPATR